MEKKLEFSLIAEMENVSENTFGGDCTIKIQGSQSAVTLMVIELMKKESQVEDIVFGAFIARICTLSPDGFSQMMHLIQKQRVVFMNEKRKGGK